MAGSAGGYYPPVGFYFVVAFSGGSSKQDNAFNEVSGLKVDTDTTTIKEGGENRFEYKVPVRHKHDNLVLKRGLMLADSPIGQWCFESLSGSFEKKIEPRRVFISLLNPSRKPLMMWTFENVWPVKWELGALNAQKNEIAVETLELAYTYFSVKHIIKTGTEGLFAPS